MAHATPIDGAAAAVASSTSSTPSAPAPATAAPQPCRVAGLPHEVLCGHLTRPLNPAAPQGVQIAVHYVVVPALARRKLPDPVFLLAGGPGQSAITLAPAVLPLFQRLNNRRDLVFVDQRGTGRSAPLVCDDAPARSMAEQLDTERQFAQLMRCRDQLQSLPHVQGPEGLRHYTTALAMQDLDAVRQQLGAAQINLVGASYGTRAALDYQRQFPHAVRRSVLDGVAPPDMALPASAAADAQAVLSGVFTACEREPACARQHPQLRTTWATLLSALPTTTATTITLPHPLSGQPERVRLTREMLLGAVRGALYVPSRAAALPAAIADAAQGRWQGLLSLGQGLTSHRAGHGPAMGMHFSVVCAEDLPRMAAPGAAASGAAASGPEGAFGEFESRWYQRVCAQWPRGKVPEAYYRVPPSRSPVLLLSGGQDPVTPPRHAARVAQQLGPQAVHHVATNAGHGLLSLGCTRDVLFKFINAADNAAALAVDANCIKAVPRPLAFALPAASAVDAKPTP